MTLEDLPEAARRVAAAARRVHAPNDLVDGVMIAVERTPRLRAGGSGFLRLASALSALAVLAVVAAVVVTYVGNRERPAPPGGPGSTRAPVHVPPVPITQLPVGGFIEAQIAMPPGAATGSADGWSVWLGSTTTGEVTRVDLATSSISGTVQVNAATDAPYSFVPVSDGASVWAAGRDDRSLVRLDAASLTVSDRWPIDGVPYRISPVGATIWLTDFDGGRVLQVNSATGDIVTTTRLADATGLAVTPEGIWVATYGGLLARLDPESGRRLETYIVATRATDVLAVGGDLWITGIRDRQLERRLERFNIARREVTAWTDDVRAVTVVDGELWASAPGGLVQLSPTTLERLAAVPISDAETDQLVAADSRLWAFAEKAAGTFLYSVQLGPN